MVHFKGKSAVFQNLDDPAHAFLGIVLNVAHIGAHDIQAEVLHCLGQLVNALFIGGDLGFQVGNILGRVAGRVGAGGEQIVQVGLAKMTAINQLEIVDQHAFLGHNGGQWRHRPRRHPANVGMVATAGNEKLDLALVFGKDRGHHRNIGQVGAAIIGRVEHVNVAGRHGRVLGDDRFDAAVHRPQMHRHVRGIGDQGAGRIEHRAGKVQPFLDVDRIGGVLKGHPHLLGNRHEKIVENLQHDRVGIGANGRCALHGCVAGHHDMALRRHLRGPSRLDHQGCMGLQNQRRAGHRLAGQQGVAVKNRGVVPGATGENLRGGARGCRRPALAGDCVFMHRSAGHDCLHLQRFDDQRLVGEDKAELGLVQRFEGVAHLIDRAERN